MRELLIAIIGGSIGVLLPAAARAASIPTDVRLHDAEIVERDEQLGTWIADCNYILGRDSKAIREEALSEPVTMPSGEMDPHGDLLMQEAKSAEYAAGLAAADAQIAERRSTALHAYRDEERRAQQDRARIVAVESWAHRMWRKYRRRPVPALTTPARGAAVIESWRKQSNLSVEQRPTWPEDATKRTLDDAIKGVRGGGP